MHCTHSVSKGFESETHACSRQTGAGGTFNLSGRRKWNSNSHNISLQPQAALKRPLKTLVCAGGGTTCCSNKGRSMCVCSLVHLQQDSSSSPHTREHIKFRGDSDNNSSSNNSLSPFPSTSCKSSLGLSSLEPSLIIMLCTTHRESWMSYGHAGWQ